MSPVAKFALVFAIGNLVAAAIFGYWRQMVSGIGGAMMGAFIGALLFVAIVLAGDTLGRTNFIHFVTGVLVLVEICFAIWLLRATIRWLRRRLRMPRLLAHIAAWLTTFVAWECGFVVVWFLLERQNHIPFTNGWRSGVVLYLVGSLYGWIGKWDPASRQRTRRIREPSVPPHEFRRRSS